MLKLIIRSHFPISSSHEQGAQSDLRVVQTGIYASSKAALNVLSETMRVELQPFGVRVLTLMLGGCATNAHAGMPDLVLPPGSRYRPAWETIDRQKKGLVYKNKQDPAVAARNIVSDIVAGRSSYVWRGASSTLCWLCTTFMPNAVFVDMVNGDKGLDVLARENK